MRKLVEGARRLGLSPTPGQLKQFELYYAELLEWNQRINLTAIVEREEVELKHFLDSLTLLPILREMGSGPLKVIDVGSGAGLPGIPLKILREDLHLVLLESVGKKASFLKHMVELLSLENTEVLVGRAEETAHSTIYREQFDAALSRALAKLATLAELTLPYCRVGGLVIAQKKGDIAAELKRADKAIDVMGGRLRLIQQVDLPELPDNRCLIILDKTKHTPGNYPRRSGLPAHRPILSSG